MTKFIYLQTIQHTGTWFLLGFLRDHPDVGGLLVEPKVLERITGTMGPKSEKVTPDGRAVDTGFDPDRINIVFSHIACHSQHPPSYLCPRQIFTTLVMPHDLVVPLRDPLLVMITHRKRIADFAETISLYHKSTTWVMYFKFLEIYRTVHDVTWFPIDLLNDLEARADVLVEVLKAFRLEVSNEAIKICVRWAKEWPCYNSYVAGDSDSKKAYAGRDLTWFLREMPKELEALRDARLVLRPILELAGYRDLIWWD